MIGFKIFIAIYLLIVVTISALAAVTLPRTISVDVSKKTSLTGKHFSVHWLGYIPDYNNTYPEYYVCINDLLCETLYMPIAMKIVNQENSSFYFRVMQNQTPPAGWTLAPNTLGLVNKDETRLFTYSAFRTKPASIPNGRLTETIYLVVQAYYDSLYTQFYSQDSFTVTYNFLDRNAGTWTVLDTDNFDDGTTHGWGGSGCRIAGELYRSFPYSLVNGGLYYYEPIYAVKSFNISVAYSEAYVILAVKSPDSGVASIDINGVTCFVPDVGVNPGAWYQVAVPIPVGQTSELLIRGGQWADHTRMYIDDVYVIAK